MGVTIVNGTIDQVESLANLFDAYRQFYGQPSDLPAAREFLSERLKLQQSVILLALNDGEACGFTQLYPAFSSVAMRPIWILNDLFVAPEARRLGVGKRLTEAATTFAAEAGAKRLALATAVDNHSAQALYEASGWTKDDSFLHYNYLL